MGRFFQGEHSYWLLVTRYSYSPPPVVQSTTPPRPGSTHANFVCAGPGGGGHWCVSRCNDQPAGLSPTKIIIFAGPICRHPSTEGNLAFVSSRNKFPAVGGGDTGPRATRRVGGKGRGGKRLGDCDRDPDFFILSLRHVLKIQSFCKFAHNLNRYATVYHL